MARIQWPYLVVAIVSLRANPALAALVVIACGLVVSSGLHEFSHAWAYWSAVDATVSLEFTSTLGVATAVRVPHDSRSRLVAAAGPLLPTLVGAGLASLAWVTGDVLWGCAAVAFGLHGLGFLPGNSDGDVIWSLS